MDLPFYKARVRDAALEALGSVGKARAIARHWRGSRELTVDLDLQVTEDTLSKLIVKLETDRT